MVNVRAELRLAAFEASSKRTRSRKTAEELFRVGGLRARR